MSIRYSSPLLLPYTCHIFCIKSASISSPIFRQLCAHNYSSSVNGKTFTGNDWPLRSPHINFSSGCTRKNCQDDEEIAEICKIFKGNDLQEQQKITGDDQPSPGQQQMEWRSIITRRYCRNSISDMYRRMSKLENGFSTEIRRGQFEWRFRLAIGSCSKYENGTLLGNHQQMIERVSRTTRRCKDKDLDRNKQLFGIRTRNLHSMRELEEEICKLEINGSLAIDAQQIERNLGKLRSCTDKNGNFSANEQWIARSSRMRNHQQIKQSSVAMALCCNDNLNVGVSKQYHGISTKDSNNIHIDTHKSTKKQVHPWKEWNDFFAMLQQKDYLKEFIPHEVSSNNGEYQQFLCSSQMKRALLLFSQMEDDIIRYLPREHIKVLVSSSCPSSDKKILNACKRLRLLCDIREEEACQQCKVRESCLRAFSESPDSDVHTIDLVRVLQSFAVNAMKMKELPVVTSSVCKVLEEIVHICNGDKYHKSGVKNSFFPIKHHITCANNEPNKKTVIRRPGDWTCPDCKFLNFDKTRECRQCGTLKDCRKQHEPEDWECPECTFVNFRKNKKCLECSSPRHHRNDLPDIKNMKPGDWICPGCKFVNFQRNDECYRCSMRKPLNLESYGVEELEPGDWKCVKCNFRNFRRNKECYKCGAVCLVCVNKRDVKTMSTESNGWGSGKRKSSNDGKSMVTDDDENDELELDADVIIDQKQFSSSKWGQ